jgi:hypothetical protein
MAYNVMRELIIGFDISVIFFKLILFGFLIYHWKYQRKIRFGANILLVLGIMLLLLALSRVFYIMNDFYYYSVDYNLQDTIYKYIAQTIQMGALVLLIFVFERLFLSKSHLILTYVTMGLFIVNFINVFYILPDFLFSIINYSLTFVLALLTIYFFYLLAKKAQAEIKKYMSLLLGGLIIYFVGIVATTKVAMDIFGIDIRLVADFLKIGGLVIAIIGLYNLPSFGEFDWREKIRDLYIINHDGVSLYHHSFSEATASPDQDLIAGGVIGIKTMLAEMTASHQKLQVIDHQDVKIFFEYGQFVICAIICQEELKTIRFKLKEFITEFELLFSDILQSWKGDMGIFQPTKFLINKVFI